MLGPVYLLVSQPAIVPPLLRKKGVGPGYSDLESRQICFAVSPFPEQQPLQSVQTHPSSVTIQTPCGIQGHHLH